MKARHVLAIEGSPNCYAAFFFAALTLAHRALCAAAIFLRADADMVRFAGAAPVVFAAPTAGRDSFRTLAHRAFWARLIRLRADADTPRFGLV